MNYNAGNNNSPTRSRRMSPSQQIEYRTNLILFRDSKESQESTTAFRVKLQHEIDRMDNLIGDRMGDKTIEDAA